MGVREREAMGGRGGGGGSGHMHQRRQKRCWCVACCRRSWGCFCSVWGSTLASPLWGIRSLCSLIPTPFIRLPFGALSLKPCMLLSSRTHAHTYRTSHNQVGMLLPAAFITTPRQPDSPFYSYGLGVTIALGTMFALGVLATRAEPALNVLAKTVEKLTKGSFSKGTLVFAVCIGVGIGMAVGATKILFGAGLIWFICFKYVVALVLTNFINEDFVNIAWESAGVTTGPVTVPFVLSLGVGCSKAVRAKEGFGILACAFVWPAICVLSIEGLRRLR